MVSLLAWLLHRFDACRTPDLRAFTAIRSFGGGGSDSCAAPQRRGSSVHRRFGLRLTDNRPVLAGSPEFSQGNGIAECLRRTRRVASLRFSIPSASADQRPASMCKAASLVTHPASAFVAPAVLGATPLRRRLSSSRRRPWNGNSIMRHRPLSRWRSAIGSVWP
jgi:hypothetical protein